MKNFNNLTLRRFMAFILVMTLLCAFVGCGQTEDANAETVENLVSSTEESIPEPTEAVDLQPDIVSTMGTVITDKLHIRKGPGSEHESVDKYSKGDRIEILETKTVDDTVWGRTSKGWVGMGYVHMDGTPGAESDSTSNIISDGNITVLGYGIVNLNSLNVRTGPGSDKDKVAEVSRGARYAYYEVSNGWVRIESGWVSTEYFYVEGTVDSTAMLAIVTTEELNIRTGPHTDFNKVGVYVKDEIIDILAQVNEWGYTEQGWVSLSYVEKTHPEYTTGTATTMRGLNIRAEANADSEKVGEYTEGTQIVILEVKENWGKTDKGWINLNYIRYD